MLLASDEPYDDAYSSALSSEFLLIVDKCARLRFEVQKSNSLQLENESKMQH